MKIAMLVSNFIKVPPEPTQMPVGFSGAPEAIAWQLTEELVKKGHEVTLFASGDSKTSAKLESIAPQSSFSQPKGSSPEFILDQEHLLVSSLYRQAKENRFDIIHSHLGSRSAFYASYVNTPTAVTIHSPLDGEAGSVLKHFPRDQHYISISDNQRKPLPNLNYAATIYHGLDLATIPFKQEKEDFLLYVGRIMPQKGVLTAIRAALELGKKLLILGTPPLNSTYYQKEIEPFIDGKQISIMGFVDHKTLYDLMGRASALLFPIEWEEPFGLVMIEAMACGTPVVAFNRGSVAEVLLNNEVGFAVDPSQGIMGFMEAVKQIGKIDPNRCRAYVRSRFEISRMVEDYEAVYTKILNSKYEISSSK